MNDAVESYLKEHPEWRDNVDLLVAPPDNKEGLDCYPELQGSDVLRDRLTSFGFSRLALYVRLRREGQKHRFAEMIACQAGPALMTDVTFFQGMPSLGEQFGTDSELNHVLRVARSHGYNPNRNDIYHPGLARFRGDPEAFVPPTGGRGYIRKLCESRGWAAEGAVNVEARPPEKDPFEGAVPLAEDLVQKNMKDALTKDPSLKKLGRKKLREKIIDKHAIKP